MSRAGASYREEVSRPVEESQSNNAHKDPAGRLGIIPPSGRIQFRLTWGGACLNAP